MRDKEIAREREREREIERERASERKRELHKKGRRVRKGMRSSTSEISHLVPEFQLPHHHLHTLEIQPFPASD